MDGSTAPAAAAVIVAALFTLVTAERWYARRRRHELAWSSAMALFGLGALAFLIASVAGWEPWTFRLFYLTGGVLTVPVLALGTVYLLGGVRFGDRVSLAVALISAFATGVVLTAPLQAALVADEINDGRDVLGVLPRVLAAAGSGVAALVVIVGALWSALRLPRRLASANVLIAVGTLVVALKGPFERVTSSPGQAFATALVSGLAIMFAGFVVATSATNAGSGS